MNWKKIVKRVLIALLVIVIVIAGIIYGMFRHEISSLMSLKKIDDYTLYTMEYDGDYGFDDFLKTGASNDGELVDFVVKKLLKGLPVEFSIPNLGCSTFNAQTQDGDKVFGRNFDLTYSPALFVKTQPDNGYASMSIVNLGFLGFNKERQPDSLMKQITTLAAPYAPLDGLNEKGLSIGVLYKAATVDEAVALLKQYDMHSSAKSSYHFQIADANGKSVVVEYVDNEISVVDAKKSYQMATNFLLTPGDYDFGMGQDRYDIMKNILDKNQGVITDEQAGMDILQAASSDWHKNDRGEESATQWSVLYNNTDLTAKIVMGRKYDQPAHEFSLK